VGGGGGPKCGNNSGFLATRGGRDANGGVAWGPFGGEKRVGGTATIIPFKGCGGAAWKGVGDVSGRLLTEERRARRDVAGGGGGGGPSRGDDWTGEAGAYDAWAPTTVLLFKPVQTESINSNTFKFILNNFKLHSI
jgi:hypothetical protein